MIIYQKQTESTMPATGFYNDMQSIANIWRKPFTTANCHQSLNKIRTINIECCIFLILFWNQWWRRDLGSMDKGKLKAK